MTEIRVCAKCGCRTANPGQILPRLLCHRCWLREEQQDRAIASKFNSKATPELPFRPTKETTRAKR